jgi:hypothetical protein
VRRTAVALACCALGLAFAGSAAASGTTETPTRAVVNTGHTSGVRGLEFDEKRNLLFSAGDDGTVRIWDAANGSIVRKLQVTQLAAERVAVNPVAPQVAVVVTDGTGLFFLSVWDWEADRQVFRVPLKEEPPFLRFSGMGSFLLYGESSWQGLRIVRSNDGTAVAFHPEGFGIVAFAEMSRSEKTLMTYQVSGRITYWDFATGQQISGLETVPYLSAIRISRDKRYLVGSTGREIVMIDAVTGAARGRADYAAALSVDMSPTGDEVSALSALDGKLSQWKLSGVALLPRQAPVVPAGISSCCYGSDGLFLAQSAGGLASVSSDGAVDHFAANVLGDVTGFAVGQDMVALGSAGWVRVLATDLFSNPRSPTYMRSLLVRNPFQAPLAMRFLSAAKLVAWRTDNASPQTALLDVSGLQGQQGSAPSFLPVDNPFRAPLSELHVSEDRVLGIEAGGLVRLADALPGVSRFEARIPGAAAAAVSTRGDLLLVGRNSAIDAGGSILAVNARTGETVPIPDRNAFTFALLLDSAGSPPVPVLYSVGIDAAGATNLLRHDGAGFEKETLLDSVAEEDLDASMTVDPVTHVLYASLGRDRIVSWDGKRLAVLPVSNASPRKLLAANRLLYSLNRDATVTVLDGVTGAPLAELSLFADGEWCALLRDGRYAASLGGDVHVKVFAGGSPVGATEDYRLRLGE